MMDMSMRGPTRRQFVGTASGVLAGLAVGLPTRLLSATECRSRLPVIALFPEFRDPADLRDLAQQAIGAAVDAGAQFADIRLVERRLYQTSLYGTLVIGRMGFDYSYGLRVCVDGQWGTGYGVDPTPDSIARAAQAAVAQVQRLPRQSGTDGLDTASVSVSTGEWRTPVAIDPFAVPPDDHVAMMAAHANAVNRVRGANASINFAWHGEMRIVATSEGTLVTQSLLQAMPTLQQGDISASDPLEFRDGFSSWSTGVVLGAASAGFEITEGAALQEHFKTFAEETVRLASYPTVAHYPVGRYDAVLDGRCAGRLLGETVIAALSLDRVLGHHRHRDGDSFLRPLSDHLAQPAFSPLLTVTADRIAPHVGAARWDDEGVPTRTFPVIADGAIVGVFGTRTTVAELSPAVTDTIHALPLSGSAVAPLPTRAPTGNATAVQLAPASDGASLDAMIAGMDRGIALLGGIRVSLEPSLGHGMVLPEQCFEVKQGKLTRRIIGAGMQFSTTKAWRNVEAIGDASTVQVGLAPQSMGAPATLSTTQMSAPAVQFRDMGLIDVEASLS